MKHIAPVILMISLFSLPALAQKSEKLIEVASFGQNQPIGVTVAPSSNRLFVSFPYHEPFLYGLTEIVDGKRVPYPDTAWNHHVLDNPDAHFVNVQDLYADDRNCLWVLDSAPAGGAAVIGNSKAKQGQFKLMKISLDDNAIKRIYTFDDLPKDKVRLTTFALTTAVSWLIYLTPVCTQ